MAKNIYEDFLRLTGFEEDEMGKYILEWRKASARIRLTEEDIRYATEEWIPLYFDISLEGVRKSLGAYMKEFIELTKAGEYKEMGMKVVYGIPPANPNYYYALKLTAPDKVFVAFPDEFMARALNMFFHRLNPYLEEAERTGTGGRPPIRFPAAGRPADMEKARPGPGFFVIRGFHATGVFR